MRGAVTLLSLLLAGGGAVAEDAPFDMSPERAALPVRAKTEAVSVRRAPAPEARRHLLSLTEPRLVGEEATRSWAVYLTEAETAGATLQLGYASSIFVAPEASRLRLSINGTPVVDTPIRAAEAPGIVRLDLPPGVLRPGGNAFRLAVQQRHRTDCSVGSTYDLWTALDPALTFLSFADPAATEPHALRDVLATPVDTSGATRIAIVAPEAGDPAVAAEAIRLGAVLAEAIGPAHPVVSISEDPNAGEAELRVAFGSGTALSRAVGETIAATEARFTERDGAPVLLVGSNAVDALAEALRPAGRGAKVVRTAAWQLPDAPMVEGASRFDFAALGVAPLEVSGRRATTGFQIALPADFYAQNYGEARLVLDGAYSGVVSAGSRLDVYVNGNLASTMPLGARGGGILRSFPLELTMRHFRPGVNEVRLEVVIESAADAACVPGTAGTETPRFALFDTSSFIVPNFARRGVLPNLAATTERGFPYAHRTEPLPLVLADGSDDTRSAAATVMAKIAQVSGAAIPVTLRTPGEANGDALFVGPVNRVPDGVLDTVAIATSARNDWSGLALDAEDAAAPQAPLSIDAWRTRVTRGTWLQPVNAVGEFLRANAPRLPWSGRAETPFAPASDTTLVLAQGEAAGGGTWTLVTAPTPDLLASGAGRLARQDLWTQLGGRLSSLQEKSDVPFIVPATLSTSVATQPWSFANARLIAANWMSGNVMAFSAALALACLLLGFATRAMLANLGRRR